MTIKDRFKFRVWDETKCKYVEYYLDYDLTFAIDIDGKLIAYASDYSDHSNCDDGYFDDSHIVEQCTGLKDKNDKLIYDNDLIMIGNKLYRVAIDDFGCRTVILDNNPFKEVIEWSDIVKIYYFHNRVDEIEVIGNIHENPDLLENKDE